VGSIGEIVLDGNFALALPIALLAGLVSFASPCVLPLVPGYLGYIGGFAGDGEKQDRRRLLLGVSFFILGFSLVFVATGVLFGTAGLLLRSWLDIITPIAGVVIIVMGLVFVGQFTFLQRQFKPQWKVATGLAGAPLLGIVFAIGWTPCLGPVLIAVNAIVFDNGDPWRGGLLASASGYRSSSSRSESAGSPAPSRGSSATCAQSTSSAAPCSSSSVC
jgi:cytochrome c-type biogenesis protein